MFVERSAARIRLVRRLFVLCGLLPLIALVAAAVWRQGATRRDGLESRIAAALSLPVSIGSVTDPRPGVMLLRDVVIGDAGGGMVSVSRLRVEESAAEIRVVVDAVECPPDAARVFARLARTWLEGEYRFRRDWVVDCGRVGWGEAAGAVPLEQVRVECVATAGARAVRLRTTGAGDGDDVRLRRLRDDDGAVRHECEARIGSPVAAAAVARGLDLAGAPAGRDATFRGEAHLTCTSDVWSGRCAGVVTGLDLGQLTAGLPDGVDGSATLQVEQAEVRDGRLVAARFECRSPGGTISRRLLAGCIDWLGCRPLRAVAAGDDIPYRDMAWSCRLGEQGLDLVGLGPQAALVADDAGPLLGPPIGTMPTDRLAWLVSPPGLPVVPASAGTGLLLPWLPIPTAGSAPSPRIER